MKKKANVYISLKRLVISMNVGIIEVWYLQASSALRVNGVLMIAAFYVGSCITCTFVTRHNVLLLIRAIGRPLSYSEYDYRVKVSETYAFANYFAEVSPLRHASWVEQFSPSKKRSSILLSLSIQSTPRYIYRGKFDFRIDRKSL